MSSLQEVRALASQAQNQQEENSENSSNPGEKGMNDATAEFLKQSWINLVPSWGLTAIYLNIHIFASKLLGTKYFCEPGTEWVRIPGKSSAATRLTGLLELIAILAVDMFLGLIILVAVVFVYILVDAWLHPAETFFKIFILGKLPGT